MNKKSKYQLFFTFFTLLLSTVSVASASNLIMYATDKAIYSSTNGITYSLLYNASSSIGSEQIVQIVSSDDGQYIYALSKNITTVSSHIIKSIDGGSSFTVGSAINYSNDIDTDSSGQYVILASGLTVNPPRTYRSINFGSTYSTVTTPTQGISNALAGVSISDNGQYVGVVGQSGSSAIIISSDFGASYTNYAVNPAVNPLSSICSSDGVNWFAGRTSLQMITNNGTVSNTWVAKGSGAIPSTAVVTFPCNGQKVVVHNMNSSNHLDSYTTHATNYTYIVGNTNLTYLYTFNTNNLLYSIDSGNTWNSVLSTTNPITAVGISGDTTYDSPASVTDLTVAISDVNTRVTTNNANQQIVYVYPVTEGSSIITGYYNILDSSSINYYNKICDFNSTRVFTDSFNYDNTTANGWSYNGYGTAIFSSGFGRSLYLNNSGFVTTLSKSMTSTSEDTEVSYIVKPQSFKVFGDESQSVIVSVQSSLGQDIAPLNIEYNATSSQMCIYKYSPTKTLIFCKPYANTYANITSYIDFGNDRFSIMLNIGGTKYYSTAIDFYTTPVGDIGKIMINPVDSNSDTFIDEITQNTVPNYPTLSVVNSTFQSPNYVWTDSCDYSTIKCYTSRFYQQDTNQQSFNHFTDFSVCSTGSSTTTGTVDAGAKNFFDDLFGFDTTTTKGSKLLVVLIVLGITFLLFIIAGAMLVPDSVKGFAIGGLVLDIGLLIAFTIIGYISVWVIILLAIIGAGMVAVFFKSVFVQ